MAQPIKLLNSLGQVRQSIVQVINRKVLVHNLLWNMQSFGSVSLWQNQIVIRTKLKLKELK